VNTPVNDVGPETSLERAGLLAGYYAAHAIECVAEGSTLVPLVASERGDERTMQRFAEGDLKVAAAQAKLWLQGNPEHADRAVSIVDGYVTLQGERVDALIIDAIDFVDGPHQLQVILPYRQAAKGFAVHRPKFAVHRGFTGDVGAFGRAFLAGAAAHETATPIWDAHRDESR
jgi:hypothetical protein